MLFFFLPDRTSEPQIAFFIIVFAFKREVLIVTFLKELFFHVEAFPFFF